MNNKYNNYKNSFRHIPDIIPGRSISTQRDEIENQGEEIINQSIEVKQQSKKVKDFINANNATSSKWILWK